MMRLQTIVVSALFLASLAPAQYLEARNTAMGGVGTASSHYLVAGFANPALLTRVHDDDDFGIMIPSVGVTVADKDGLLSDLNDFVDEVDAVQAKFNNATATTSDLANLSTSITSLSGKTATGNIGAGFVLAFPSNGFAWALHAHTYSDLSIVAQIDPLDAGRITSATNATALDGLASEIRILGVAVTEVGLSFAKRFDVGGMALSIGLTPKFQRVYTFNYSVNVDTFKDNDFDDDQFTNDETNFNVNLGVALEVTDAFTVGLMVRNLVSDEYVTTSTLGQQFTYQIEPSATLGAAWTNDTLTAAVDVDITEVERFKNGNLKFNTVLDDNSRFVRAGVELNGWDWVQIRGGIQTDLEDTVDDVYSGGIGFSPFDIWHLDLTGTYSGEDSFGGVLQMAVTF